MAGAVLGVLTLLLAACGDDDGDTETAPGAASGDDTVNVADGGDLGEILVDSDGNTLYIVDGESDDEILCVDEACLDFWPPLTVASGETPTGGDGVDGALATVERDDGTVQVTYDGLPLYTYTSDSGPGDVSGHGVSDPLTWHAVNPDGPVPLDAGEDNPGGYGGG